MNKYRVLAVIAVLVFSSLACQALSGIGRGNDVPSVPSASDDPAAPSEDEPVPADIPNPSEFPMTSDAFNVTNIGDGSLLYYTKMSQEDVLKFYRDEYKARGYTEREVVTTISDGVFSIVFDGDPSGKSVVIQSVDLGDGSSTVAIRLEDV